MTAHEVLVRARNLIDRVGWLQCSVKGHHDPGGHCVATWVATVADDAPAEFEAMYAFGRAIGIGSLPRIYEWNDAPGRTKDEVLAAFDRAIAATAPPPPDLYLTEMEVAAA